MGFIPFTRAIYFSKMPPTVPSLWLFVSQGFARPRPIDHLFLAILGPSVFRMLALACSDCFSSSTGCSMLRAPIFYLSHLPRQQNPLGFSAFQRRAARGNQIPRLFNLRQGSDVRGGMRRRRRRERGGRAGRGVLRGLRKLRLRRGRVLQLLAGDPG